MAMPTQAQKDLVEKFRDLANNEDKDQSAELVDFDRRGQYGGRVEARIKVESDGDATRFFGMENLGELPVSVLESLDMYKLSNGYGGIQYQFRHNGVSYKVSVTGNDISPKFGEDGESGVMPTKEERQSGE